MMNIIPITPATIDLITKLNNGVRPTLEDEETFYVYRGEDAYSAIITREAFDKDGAYPEWMTVIKILFIGS